MVFCMNNEEYEPCDIEYEYGLTSKTLLKRHRRVYEEEEMEDRENEYTI